MTVAADILPLLRRWRLVLPGMAVTASLAAGLASPALATADEVPEARGVAGEHAPGQETADQETADQETADRDSAGTFTLIFENDLLANTDRHYTNGIRLSWIPAGEAPRWAEAVADFLPIFPEERDVHVTWSLGQSMFTPENISISPPLPDDRPYAGWLHGTATLVSVSEAHVDALELALGVVGPASLAAETQKLVHEIIGSQDPKGWEFQLENEPGVVLSYERRFVGLPQWQLGPVQVDAVPYAGGALGNIITQAYAGGVVRLGQNMPGDFGPPRIRLGAPNIDLFEPSAGFGWYLFFGTEGRAVARNIFLDGNTFRDSPGVDRKPLVGDLAAGAAITYNGLRLSYTHVMRSEEFDGQDDPDSFGSISLSIEF